MTKKIYVFYFITLMIFIIYGCCKSICIDKTLYISFRKIKSVDADSISLIQYAPGTNYMQKTDSIFINTPVASSDTMYSPLFREINADHDWKIINHSLDKAYRLNNFELEKIRCCSDKGYVVRSFELNGTRRTGDYFEIE